MGRIGSISYVLPIGQNIDTLNIRVYRRNVLFSNKTRIWRLHEIIIPAGPILMRKYGIFYTMKYWKCICLFWRETDYKCFFSLILQITMYDIHLWKSLVSEDKLTRTTTERKAIFTDLDDNTEYQFQVRANTRKGPGPWSSKVSFRTDRNIIRAPLRVQVSTTV